MEGNRQEASPEELQFRLLTMLHRQYMDDHRTPIVLMEDALGETDPPWKDIERELIQLEYRGWIHFSSDLMPDTVMCKLTPKGREVFEVLTIDIVRRAQSVIGFVTDERGDQQ